MKNKLLIILVIFSSCGGEDNYERDIRLNKEIATFNKNLTEKQKSFIHTFFNTKKVSSLKNFKGISGGFCCIFQGINTEVLNDDNIVKNDNIVYQQEENKSLKNEGYNITSNGDSLKFVLLRDLNRSVVGQYTNKGKAFIFNTKIYALDLEKEEGFLLLDQTGGAPPSTIEARRYSGTGGHGSTMSTEEILAVYKSYINKE